MQEEIAYYASDAIGDGLSGILWNTIGEHGNVNEHTTCNLTFCGSRQPRQPRNRHIQYAEVDSPRGTPSTMNNDPFCAWIHGPTSDAHAACVNTQHTVACYTHDHGYVSRLTHHTEWCSHHQ